MIPLRECRLYTFLDVAYLAGRDPVVMTEQLCAGGADLVQLRAKSVPPDEILRLARLIQPVTSAAGVRLVVNDYHEIARAIRADVCHLGQEDFFDSGWHRVSELRTGEGPGEFGLSTHAPNQAQRAVAAGADYIAVGPVFPTGTKPGRPAVTLDYVRWAAANVSIPWFAIGGITLDNLESVRAAGATRVCVVSALLNAVDVAGACREFRRRLA